MLKKVHLEKFTAFEKLDISFSEGLNVFIGLNGVGKTHIMKVAYAACDVSKKRRNFADKLTKVFFPSNDQIGRLVKRNKTSSSAQIQITRLNENGSEITLKTSFSNHTTAYEKAKIIGMDAWTAESLSSVFIPVKDMMANAPGFQALYDHRDIHFEEIYADIIARASLPALKGPADKDRKKLLKILQDAIDGKVIQKKEEFFLKNNQGELEFTLLAEGFRKLALIWQLIQNGVLLGGSVLFWDEPEANLNPTLMKIVAEILINLQRQGVQIFVSTHDFVFLRWLSLQIKPQDKISYHSLFRDKRTNEIQVKSTKDYDEISPNAIDESYDDIADEEIRQEIGIFPDKKSFE